MAKAKTTTYRAVIDSQQIQEILGSWVLMRKGVEPNGGKISISSFFIHDGIATPIRQARIEVEVTDERCPGGF